jgi:hypothetical protein
MTNREIGPLQPTEGQRLPTSSAERVMVGFAGVALCAGLLIAAGNLVGTDGEATAQSSAAPTAASASRTPRPTRSPRPLREVAVTPSAVPPPADSPTTYPFNGWIEANVDLIIHNQPAAEAREVGVLAAGAAAYAWELDPLTDPAATEGWMRIEAPSPAGWIASRATDGSELVRRFAPTFTGSGDIGSILAGPTGFIAVAWPSEAAWTETPETIVAHSGNGASWRAFHPPIVTSPWEQRVAWGPAGWLALRTGDPNSSAGRSWVSTSLDGINWTGQGSLDLAGNDWSLTLVGSERGYLAATPDGSGSAWVSPDGLTWREGRIGINGWLRTAATALGFYAWDADSTAQGREEAAAFSLDGRSWVAVPEGPGGEVASIAERGEQLVAVDRDPDTGEPRIWTGTVSGSRLTWSRERADERLFAGAVVTGLADDDEGRLLAVGWDRESEASLVWQDGGDGWSLDRLSGDGFGGIPRLLAASAAGAVVVSHEVDLLGRNPVIWHRTATGSWVSEAASERLIPPAKPPAREACPALPTRLLELISTPAPTLVACHGATPITVRGWAATCPGCVAYPQPEAQPGWLVAPDASLAISPIDSDQYWSFNAVIGPSLGFDPAWNGQWLEVTGHFDDPAATSCTWSPQGQDVAWYEGRASTVVSCRLTFVLTAVIGVDGP